MSENEETVPKEEEEEKTVVTENNTVDTETHEEVSEEQTTEAIEKSDNINDDKNENLIDDTVETNPEVVESAAEQNDGDATEEVKPDSNAEGVVVTEEAKEDGDAAGVETEKPSQEEGEPSPADKEEGEETKTEGTEEGEEGASKAEGEETTSKPEEAEGQVGADVEGASDEKPEVEEGGEEGGEVGEKPAEGDEQKTEGEAKEGDEKPKAEGEEGDEEPKPEGEEGDEEPKPEGEEGDGEPKAEGAEGDEEPKAEGEEGSTSTELGAKDGEQAEKQDDEHLTAIAEGADDEEEAMKMASAFDNEERPESELRVGEKLDDTGEYLDEEGHDRPEFVGSPHEEYDEEEMEDEYEEEEEEEEVYFDREALEKKYKQAIAERKQLHEQNNVLQNKLAEYFRKKKADSEAAGGNKLEVEKSSSEYEQRYIKYLSNLEDLKRQYANLQEEYQLESEELKEQSQLKEVQVDEERLKFMAFKKQVGLKAINSRTGRSIVAKDLDILLSNEQKKESDVLCVRLENIKLQNRLNKEEQALKSKEELAEGLYMIDFEQLKLENQTYNEKIEERNEEILKLRKKITSTVQVLTHLKEKLQFVKQENHAQRAGLSDVDAILAKKRDTLSRTKQQRDSLRLDNNKLRQNCGMLGNEMLLRDMETCVDKVSERKTFLERMRMEHAELTLKTNGFRRKIDQSKSADALGMH